MDFPHNRKNHYCCKDKNRNPLKPMEHVLRIQLLNYISNYLCFLHKLPKYFLTAGFEFPIFQDKKSEDSINQKSRQVYWNETRCLKKISIRFARLNGKNLRNGSHCKKSEHLAR